MKRNRGLSPAQHLELGNTIKHARRLLHEAAVLSRPYGRIAQRLLDLADAIPRNELEAKLMAEVGADGVVDGVRARDVYFGELLRELEEAG